MERARNRCNQVGEAKPTETELVLKAHRLLYHSTLGLRVTKKKREELEHGRHRLRQSYKMTWIGATCPDRRAPGPSSPYPAPVPAEKYIKLQACFGPIPRAGGMQRGLRIVTRAGRGAYPGRQRDVDGVSDVASAGVERHHRLHFQPHLPAQEEKSLLNL